MTLGKQIVLVVEDELSEAVMRKVLAHHGGSLRIGTVITSGGFGNIKTSFAKFKTACRALPHIVFTDLDQHACPSSLKSDWRIGDLPPSLLFSIAVRSVESWLLADRDRMAAFLRIPTVKIAQAPESLADSKRELISLARRARSRRLASEICPELGSVARQGPLYNAHMIRFVRESWRVSVAANSSQSLARACQRIDELEARLEDDF